MITGKGPGVFAGETLTRSTVPSRTLTGTFRRISKVGDPRAGPGEACRLR
jgi:hypothetical protein